MACQIGYRFVAIADDRLLYCFADCGRTYAWPDQLQRRSQAGRGGLRELFVAAQVNGDRGIGNVAIHVHTHIQFDHTLAKYALISGRWRVMGSHPVQGYVAGKGRLCAF